ncbi:uncharacterized protein LOC134683643 [Mytilus trossulus]|uniref:uncharacterized protein LOC134683643 n=1 Tax=Mytilus trossulus TaxID=6551 RepID=UPI0030077DCC
MVMILYMEMLLLILMVPEVFDFDMQCPKSGFKRVLRPAFDSELCSSKRYQPFHFNTTGHNVCVFDKSVCSEEGQLAYDTGTTIKDRTCRCDYTRGYVFIMKPNQTGGCFCIPSEEDCSCTLKKCEKDFILSADYKCIGQDVLPTDNACPTIQVNEKNTTIQMTLNLQNKGERRTVPVIPVIGFWIVIIALPFVLFGVERIKDYFTRALIMSPLEDITCIEGQTAVFTCELRKTNMKVKWLKDSNILYETGDSMIIKSEDKVHVLIVNNTKKLDNGLYSICINKESSTAHLKVRGVELTVEEVNYLRLVHLMLRIATPVVRAVFDTEFDPNQLRSGQIFKRNEIEKLVKQKHLTEKDRDVVLPVTRNPFPSSENFDIKQMITLIRNFTEIEIVDVLPKSSNKSKGADLSRLKFYRNTIVHNDGSFSKEDFTSYWNDICKAVVRLGVNDINQGNTPRDEHDPLAKAILESVAKDYEEGRNSIKQSITKEELLYLRIVHLLHREACPAVRVKFDVLFPLFSLKQILQAKVQILSKQKGKKISHVQWDLIYPKTGIPLSRNFSLQLMATCIWFASDREKITMDEWQAIQELEKYIYKVEQHKGFLNMTDFNKYWDEISKRILFIGGENFTRSTTYLALNTEHNTISESTAS